MVHLNSYKILLIFSLVLVMMGTACAAENVTDEVIAQNGTGNSQIMENINVTFEEQMWEENLTDITVDLPEEASGEFCLKVGSDVLYNRTITEKSFKVPIKLTKPKFEFVATVFPPIDYKAYGVSAFYNGEDLNINRTLKVMKFSPDYNLIRFPEEILQGSDPQMLRMMFPRSANGIVELYLDDRLLNRTRISGPYPNIDFSDVTRLDLGNHTLRVMYYNDTYYADVNRTFNFTVVKAVISIPETINIGHDTCVSVDVLKGVQGTVRIYLDGKMVCNRKYEQYFVFSLEDYVMHNSSEVTVEFISKQFSRVKTQKINVTYDLEVYSPENYIYGEENVIELYLPDNLNNNLLKVEINGVPYQFTHPENIMNNIQEVDISKIPVGNYTMFISYPGDARFEAKNSTFNFTVRYDVIYPGWDVEYMEDSYVVLRLPSDAAGTFSLYVDGVLFKTVQMSNGVAKISLAGISVGGHELNATYEGDDYTANLSSSSLHVGVRIITDYRFTAGEDKYVSVELSKDSTGYVIFIIDDKEYNVTVKNGIARLSLKNLKAGEHDIDIDYYGSGGFTDYAWRTVTVLKPKVTIVSAKLYATSVNAKIKVLNNKNRPIANAVVSVKINGKTFKVKTNAKGIATLKKSLRLKVKKYRLTASCNGGKASKTLKAKSVIALKATKKSKRKAVLAATLKEGKSPLKSKSVKFKFAGKTYSAKTNSRGVAKISVRISSIQAGKKVVCRANYLASSAKKSLKI